MLSLDRFVGIFEGTNIATPGTHDTLNLFISRSSKSGSCGVTVSKHVMSVHRWGDKTRASVRQCAGSDTRWVWGCMSPRSGLDWWSRCPYTVIVLMMSWFTVLILVHSFAVCSRWFRSVLEIVLLNFNIDSDNETYLLTYLLTYSMGQTPFWEANWFCS